MRPKWCVQPQNRTGAGPEQNWDRPGTHPTDYLIVINVVRSTPEMNRGRPRADRIVLKNMKQFNNGSAKIQKE